MAHSYRSTENMEPSTTKSQNMETGEHYAGLVIRLYSLIFLSLAVALPFMFIITDGKWQMDSTLLTALQIYAYFAGSVFLLYLVLYGRYSLCHFHQSLKDDTKTSDTVQIPPLYNCQEGVNLLLRYGLIAFALMSVLLVGFELVAYIEVPDLLWRCLGPADVISDILMIIYISLQTYVLFKYSKTCFNFHLPLVRLGFAHMIVTNIFGWTITLCLEASENLHESIERLALAEEGEEEQANSAQHEDQGIPQDVNTSVVVSGNGSRDCTYSHTISSFVDPYLYPFFIEYVLLAATITYKLLTTSGPTHYHGNHLHEENEPEEKLPSYGGCHKANFGLILGLFLFTIVTLGTCVFVYYATLDDDPLLSLIHFTYDVTLNGLSLLALIPTIFLLRTFSFPEETKLTLDHYVLLITLMGYYILLFAMAQGSFTIHKSQSDEGLRVGIMSVVDLLQCTLQTACIIHGSHRYPGHSEQVHTKPGRTLLTLHILFNFAMWLVNTFQLKELMYSPANNRYFGSLAWIILVDASLPLAIFFRFHSAVCLTEIWITMYEHKPTENKKDLNVAESTSL